MRRPWRDRLRIPLFALLALDAGVYVAYTMPRSLRERSVALRADVLRQEVERDRRLTRKLRRRTEAMNTNRSDVQRFYARLGPKETLAEVREQIRALARELGLRVGALTYSPEEVKGSEGVAEFGMKMGVSGTYRELAAFLDRLERSPYFVTVDQIQLRKKGATEGEADLDISLTAFYRSSATGGGVS